MKIVVLAAIVLVGISVSQSAKAGLLFHYDFEGKELEDASGNKNLGEVRGDPEQVIGPVGMALKFDGADDYIFTAGEGNAVGPLIFTHNAYTEKSMAVWIQADDVDGDHTIYEEGGTAQGYGIRINAGELQLSVRNGSVEATVLADYKDTDWHHIAGVYKEGELHLYIDGEEVASGDAGYQQVGTHANESAIGATFDDDSWGRDQADNPWNFFEGIMDEFYFYDNALSAKEVNDLYQQGAAVEPNGRLTTTWASIKALSKTK